MSNETVVMIMLLIALVGIIIILAQDAISDIKRKEKEQKKI